MSGGSGEAEHAVDEAYYVMALCAVATRVGVLLVAASGMVTSVVAAAHRPAAAIAVVTVVMSSIAFCARALSLRRLPGPGWLIADSAIILLAMASSPMWLNTSHTHAGWVAWPEYLALNACAIAGGASLSGLVGLGVGSAWAGAWLVSIGLGLDLSWSELAGTALNYLQFAVIVGAVAGYVYRLAERADDARRVGEALAKQTERHRARVLIHDSAGVMAMLAHAGESETDQFVRNRAQQTINRLRHYLADDVVRTGDDRDLADVVHRVCASHSDLPIVELTDLARHTPLSAEVASAVEDAVHTALENVRRHADATSVVVHARTDDGRWVVSVRDDGVGFDQAVTPRGFGLSQQVEAAVQNLGLFTVVDSAPGEGTTILLSSSAAEPPPLRELRTPSTRPTSRVRGVPIRQGGQHPDSLWLLKRRGGLSRSAESGRARRGAPGEG